MKEITDVEMERLFSYREFIPFLAGYLSDKVEVPQRSHLEIGENTLLLMPAWNNKYLGVKIATAFPGNRSAGKPTIHAVYTLFSAHSGEPLLQLDGKVLTNKRTAAASALASSYLSRTASRSLLVLGNGALCPELIKAHAAVRPLINVKIWGRNPDHVKRLVAEQEWGSLKVSVSLDKQADMEHADIISCATSATEPVLEGQYIASGVHIDLVGSYKPDMREADDTVITRAVIFIDNEAAMHESGDIAIPLQSGLIGPGDIRGTLADLASGACSGRTDANSISLFKSVGFALEDLAAAEYFYNKVSEGMEA